MTFLLGIYLFVAVLGFAFSIAVPLRSPSWWRNVVDVLYCSLGWPLLAGRILYDLF
jgi:hypothetical protein